MSSFPPSHSTSITFDTLKRTDIPNFVTTIVLLSSPFFPLSSRYLDSVIRKSEQKLIGQCWQPTIFQLSTKQSSVPPWPISRQRSIHITSTNPIRFAVACTGLYNVSKFERLMISFILFFATRYGCCNPRSIKPWHYLQLQLWLWPFCSQICSK